MRVPAFSASWLRFCALLPSYFPALVPFLADPAFAHTPLGKADAEARALSTQVAARARSASSSSSSSDVTAVLQKSLASISVEERRAKLFESASPVDLARLHSASADHALAWLHAIPSSAELSLPPTQFCIAVCLLLGAPLPIALPDRCPCGESPDQFGHHLLTCKRLGGMIFRHDAMVHEVGRLAAAAGVLTETEVSHVITKSRLDMILHGYGERKKDLVLDVKVVTPVAKGHVRVAQTPLGVAVQGEQQKIRRYGALCAAAHMSFAPVVWESFGGAGKDTLAFLASLIRRVPVGAFSAPNWSAASPSALWWQRLSVCLQRYNAQIVERFVGAARFS
jgi:hypothetical protein